MVHENLSVKTDPEHEAATTVQKATDYELESGVSMKLLN